MQDAYPGVLDEHEGHTPKSCCPINQSMKTHFYSAICRERIRGAAHSLSRVNLKKSYA